MTENQKDQTVTNNRDGKKQETPTDQSNNQKQGNPTDQGSLNKTGDTSNKSSGTEEEKESTEEIIEMEDGKHPHKQGVPVASEEKSNSGI